MTRWIELSHWGNIAVEETYHITHTGAQLKVGYLLLGCGIKNRHLIYISEIIIIIILLLFTIIYPGLPVYYVMYSFE